MQVRYLTYFLPLVTLVILLSLMNVDRSLIGRSVTSVPAGWR